MKGRQRHSLTEKSRLLALKKLAVLLAFKTTLCGLKRTEKGGVYIKKTFQDLMALYSIVAC